MKLMLQTLYTDSAEVPIDFISFVLRCLYVTVTPTRRDNIVPDKNIHGANMGPIWDRQGPGGPHVGPMNFAIWGIADTQWSNEIYLNQHIDPIDKGMLYVYLITNISFHIWCHSYYHMAVYQAIIFLYASNAIFILSLYISTLYWCCCTASLHSCITAAVDAMTKVLYMSYRFRTKCVFMVSQLLTIIVKPLCNV